MLPPILALILCTVFVLFLLRLDRKQATEVSQAFWIPTIWMLYTASKSLSTWFGYASESDEAGSPLDRNFQMILFSLSFILLVTRKLNWSRVIKKNAWLILLIGYMLISILWSDIIYVSFKRWVRELIAVFMAFLVLTERNPRQAMECILRRTTYVLIPFSLLLIKYYQNFGIVYSRWTGERSWVGVAMQKNGLARLCLISAFYLIWTLIRRWQGRDVPVKYQTLAEVFVLSITLDLFFTPDGLLSATAFVSLALGLATFIGFLWLKKHRIHLRTNVLTMFFIVLIGFGIVTPLVGGSTVTGFTSSLGRNETLTGRTDIWAGLLPSIKQQPILGFGFGAFWTSRNEEIYGQKEAHSGYLDVLLGLGIIGLFLTTMFLLSSYRKAIRKLDQDYDWGILCICYILMAVMHNISETSFDSLTRHLTAVILFLAVTSTATNSQTSKNNISQINLAK